MTDSLNSTESKTTSTESGYADKTDDVKKEEDKSNTDDYGYSDDDKSDKDTDVDTSKKDDDSESDKGDDDKKVEDPATGYEKDLEIDDTKKENKDDDTKKEGEELSEEDVKKEIETALGDLPETFDKEKVSKFALDNKLSKEQVEAYAKFAKAESDQSIKDNQEQVIAQRKSWKDELKNDADFGGEHFDKNIHKVEKMLDKHMPNMKKVLTDRGGMVPPYIMKDLLKIHKVLNPTTSFESGGPGKTEDKEDNFLDTFYE